MPSSGVSLVHLNPFSYSAYNNVLRTPGVKHPTRPVTQPAPYAVSQPFANLPFTPQEIELALPAVLETFRQLAESVLAYAPAAAQPQVVVGEEQFVPSHPVREELSQIREALRGLQREIQRMQVGGQAPLSKAIVQLLIQIPALLQEVESLLLRMPAIQPSPVQGERTEAETPAPGKPFAARQSLPQAVSTFLRELAQVAPTLREPLPEEVQQILESYVRQGVGAPTQPPQEEQRLPLMPRPSEVPSLLPPQEGRGELPPTPRPSEMPRAQPPQEQKREGVLPQPPSPVTGEVALPPVEQAFKKEGKAQVSVPFLAPQEERPQPVRGAPPAPLPGGAPVLPQVFVPLPSLKTPTPLPPREGEISPPLQAAFGMQPTTEGAREEKRVFPLPLPPSMGAFYPQEVPKEKIVAVYPYYVPAEAMPSPPIGAIAEERREIGRMRQAEQAPAPLPPPFSTEIPFAFIVPYVGLNAIKTSAPPSKTGKARGMEDAEKEEVGIESGKSLQLLSFVPEGGSWLGDPFDEGAMEERPLRPLSLPRFAIGTYLVTNQQFAEFLTELSKQKRIVLDDKGRVRTIEGDIVCQTKAGLAESDIETEPFKRYLGFRATRGKEAYPMVYVSYEGARAFCAFGGFRLPTEAEWEKAAGVKVDARGKAIQKFRYGCSRDSIDPSLACYGSKETTPVGFFSGVTTLMRGGKAVQTSRAVSPFGCYDMSGNVWEWTATQEEEKAVVKGGCFSSPEGHLRVSARKWEEKKSLSGMVGFRVTL